MKDIFEVFWKFSVFQMQIFQEYDEDGDGKVIPGEVKSWLEHRGKYITMGQADQIVDKMVSNRISN